MNQRDGKELQRTQMISHHKKNLSVQQSKIQFKNSNKPENTIQNYENAQITNFGFKFKSKLFKI